MSTIQSSPGQPPIQEMRPQRWSRHRGPCKSPAPHRRFSVRNSWESSISWGVWWEFDGEFMKIFYGFHGTFFMDFMGFHRDFMGISWDCMRSCRIEWRLNGDCVSWDPMGRGNGGLLRTLAIEIWISLEITQKLLWFGLLDVMGDRLIDILVWDV